MTLSGFLGGVQGALRDSPKTLSNQLSIDIKLAKLDVKVRFREGEPPELVRAPLKPLIWLRNVSIKTVMLGSGLAETGCLSEMRKVLMPTCSWISSSSCLMKMASATPDAIA